MDAYMASLVEDSKEFIAAFGTDIVAKLAPRGRKISDPHLAVDESWGIVVLKFTLLRDPRRSAGAIGCRLDRTIYDPDEPVHEMVRRVAACLGVSRREAHRIMHERKVLDPDDPSWQDPEDASPKAKSKASDPTFSTPATHRGITRHRRTLS